MYTDNPRIFGGVDNYNYFCLIEILDGRT